jgi:single-stranded-DNA-specific exonuclease
VRERNPQFEAELAAELALPLPLAAILRSRGLTTVSAAREFLNPPSGGLYDPFTLPDMEPAVDRLQRALEAGEPILVHGDYDADGVTSAALLVRVLSKLGADIHYFIPHRFHDHYGLSERAVRMSNQKGIGLLVAVDCGISDHEVIALAQGTGAEVIVVDHHQPGPDLPPGALVINPKRRDSEYPFGELTAAGLAYKVASGLCQRLGVNEASLARAFLDLVCVGRPARPACGPSSTCAT